MARKSTDLVYSVKTLYSVWNENEIVWKVILFSVTVTWMSIVEPWNNENALKGKKENMDYVMLSTLKQYFCLSQPCLLCTLCIKYAIYTRSIINTKASLFHQVYLRLSSFDWLVFSSIMLVLQSWPIFWQPVSWRMFSSKLTGSQPSKIWDN